MVYVMNVWSGFFSSAQDWVNIFSPLHKSRQIKSLLSLVLGLEVVSSVLWLKKQILLYSYINILLGHIQTGVVQGVIDMW